MTYLFDYKVGLFRFFMPITSGFWPIVAAVLMGAMKVRQIQGQNAAAQAQQENIAATTRMNYKMKEMQEQELKAQAGAKLTEEAIKRYAERGKIQAAQAESGVAGVSPLRELSNTYFQESLTKGSIVSEEEAKQATIGIENMNTYLQGLSQIKHLESQKSSGIDSAVQIGMTALQGYTMADGSFGAETATSAPSATTASQANANIQNLTSLGYTNQASNLGAYYTQQGVYLP